MWEAQGCGVCPWTGQSHLFEGSAMRQLTAACTAGLLFTFAGLSSSMVGCKSKPSSGSGSPTAAAAEGGKDTIVVSGLKVPATVQPVEAIAPLSFLAGRWIGVNPNKTVNEEHWMAPRGNHMVGTFRQVRRDGKPALVEISLIAANEDGVTLRLRHLHTGLEVPEKRKELSIFTLKEAGNNRAEFTGTGKAEQVSSVVYRLESPDVLIQEVNFSPDSKEKGYSLRYVREK